MSTTTEYRVVGKAQASPSTIESPVTRDRAEALRVYDEFVGVYRDVQLQARTVTTTPWVEACSETASLTAEEKEGAELQGVAAGQCPFCQGDMDSYGGVHLKDCPIVLPPVAEAAR